MARHVLKAINTAAPPKEGGGAVGECWRVAAGVEGAKVAELFGKQLVKAPDFAQAVTEALKTVQTCQPAHPSAKRCMLEWRVGRREEARHREEERRSALLARECMYGDLS